MGKKLGATPAVSNPFDAQYDGDTLTRAAEIKGQPARHRAAIKHLAKKAKALTTVVKEAKVKGVSVGQHINALAVGHMKTNPTVF
jgi:hypothetical protein